MSAVITHENEVVLSNGVQAWISDLDLLKYLDIVKEDLILNIETDKGKIKLKPVKVSKDELCNPRKDSIQKSETLNPKGLYWKKYYKELDTCRSILDHILLVENIMTTPVRTLRPQSPLREALDIMTGSRIKRLPIKGFFSSPNLSATVTEMFPAFLTAIL